jgi:hypothetical protein
MDLEQRCKSECEYASYQLGDYQRCYEACLAAKSAGGGAKPRKGSYETLTVKELKERCAKRGIKHSGLKKIELIAALRRRNK